MIHERCYLCNKVSSRDIETSPGDFIKKRFVRDEHYAYLTVCEECKEVFEELMLEYEKQDDIYGWLINESANDNDLEEILSLEDVEEILAEEDFDG